MLFLEFWAFPTLEPNILFQQLKASVFTILSLIGSIFSEQVICNDFVGLFHWGMLPNNDKPMSWNSLESRGESADADDKSILCIHLYEQLCHAVSLASQWRKK